MTGATALNLLLLPGGEHLVSGESDGTVTLLSPLQSLLRECLSSTHPSSEKGVQRPTSCPSCPCLAWRLSVWGLGLKNSCIPCLPQVRVLDEKTRGPSTVSNHAHKGGVTGMCHATGGGGGDKVLMFASGGGADGLIKLWSKAWMGDGGTGDSFVVCCEVHTGEERGLPLILQAASGGSRIAACGGGLGCHIMVYDVVWTAAGGRLVELFKATGHEYDVVHLQGGGSMKDEEGGGFVVSGDEEGSFRTWSLASRKYLASPIAPPTDHLSLRLLVCLSLSALSPCPCPCPCPCHCPCPSSCSSTSWGDATNSMTGITGERCERGLSCVSLCACRPPTHAHEPSTAEASSKSHNSHNSPTTPSITSRPTRREVVMMHTRTMLTFSSSAAPAPSPAWAGPASPA